jgi:short-subunit dehydrogenase
MELDRCSVLITGASRGIGAALAERFAAAGARPVLVARSADTLGEVAARTGGAAVPADLTDPDVVAGLVARIEADHGPIDVVVNNAGIGEPACFLDGSDAEDRRTFQLNVLTPMSLCRQAAPGMVARGRGHLVNVSSLAGFVPFPGLATYAATKAALSQYTAALRADLRGLPVGTTLVELGPVPTELLDEVQGYRPTADAFGRAAALRLSVDVDRRVVADAVVDAVRHRRRHVRLPRRATPFALLAEAPRRITEVALTGVRPRAR